MKLIKIAAPVLGALAILGTTAEGDAALCRRIPSGSGLNPYPTSGEIRNLNVGCPDGTRGNLIVDASPKELRVKLVNKVTAFATIRLTGRTSQGFLGCFAQSTTVGVEDIVPCPASTTQWFGEIRND